MTSPPFPAAAIAAARDAAKAYLRSASDAEESLIEAFAATALALCEAFTGRSLIARGWSVTLPASSAWQQLGIGPVYSIGPVEGLSDDGAAVALPVSDYAIDIDADGEGWVRIIAAGAAARVRGALARARRRVGTICPRRLRRASCC